MSKINLDHHHATKPAAASIEAMLPFLLEPSEPAPNICADILKFLGAKEGDKFYFFASGADAVDYVYQSHYFDVVRHTGKNHIVTTSSEEAHVMMSLKRLEELGCSGKRIEVNSQGQLTREMLGEAVNPRTSLVSLAWANRLTGVVHPIADLAECCRQKGVRLHVDASCAIGKQYFRFEDLHIDFLTFDGSLIHAPKGTAGLVVKAKTPFSPPVSSMVGAPVGLLAALAKGLEEGDQMFDYVCLETARLRDRLEQGIVRGFSEAEVLFAKAERLPNCTSIAFPGVFGEALLFLLNRKGISAALVGESGLSFSLSYETRQVEIDRAVEVIVECAQKLKGLSVHL